MSAIIREWFSHPSDTYTQLRNENRGYALIGANVVLVVMVLVCFLLKLQHITPVPIPGCEGKHPPTACKAAQLQANPPEPHFSVWLFFLVFEVVAVSLYWINAFLPSHLGTRVISSIGGTLSEASKGFQFPLGLTVLPNAYALGYLTFKTGGLSISPYAQVLIAMLIVAQQAKKDIPEREVHWGFWRTLGTAMREYKPFLVVAGVFYGALLIAESAFTPPRVATAPAGLAFGLSAALFVIATIANYVIGSTPRDRHELLDWTDAGILRAGAEEALEVTGTSPLPVKVSLDPQHPEMSEGDFRAIYVHGFIEVERPREQMTWSAKLPGVEACSGKRGVVLVGATMRQEFPLRDDDEGEAGYAPGSLGLS